MLRNFKGSEILDFLKRDFPDYSWSLASLSRRVKYFDIKYTDYSTTVEQVRAAFQEENNGPGQLLGYRAMHKQIREKHGLAVPRGLVYDVMTLDDEDGLQRRKAMGKEEKKGYSRSFYFTGRLLVFNRSCSGPFLRDWLERHQPPC